jgi:hypothetical protein
LASRQPEQSFIPRVGLSFDEVRFSAETDRYFSCSGTEMTSYKRKDYGDEKVSDDENEPLTFLSGTKRIQIQVINY